MKQIIALSLVFLLALPMLVLAETIPEVRQVRNNQDIIVRNNNTNLEPTLISANETNGEPEPALISEEKLEIMENRKKQVRERKENMVRDTVKSLLSLGNRTGIGTRVSEVARSFNNSAQNMEKVEMKIKRRSSLSKFFFGGNVEAAEELETELETYRSKIQEMKQIKEESGCEDDCREVLQTQIQEIEQERERLSELVNSEINNKGLFGWLFRR